MSNKIKVELELTPEQLKKIKKQLGVNEKSCFDRVDRKEKYYHMGNNGRVRLVQDFYTFVDDDFYNVANYCTDRDLLQQQAYKETLNRLLWRFSMQNGGDKIDFSEDDAYIIYWDDYAKDFDYGSDGGGTFGVVYFISSDVAKKAIDEIVKPFMKQHPDFKF